MGNPDLLATYLLLLSFITLSFFIKEPFDSIQSKAKKIFYTSALTIFLFTILIAGSRAVYLGLFIGGLYFLLFYPKKIKHIKIIVLGLLIFAAGFIFYTNTINQYPIFLENNKIFKSIVTRL
jgi:hypothetical protein